MDFIDWDNEYEYIYGGSSVNTDGRTYNGLNIPHGMSEEAFIREMGDEALNEEEFELKDGLDREIMKKIKRMKMKNSSQDCAICCHKFEADNRIWKLPCNHIFHDKCLIPWLEKNHSCPNCRLDLKEHFEKYPDGNYDKK